MIIIHQQHIRPNKIDSRFQVGFVFETSREGRGMFLFYDNFIPEKLSEKLCSVGK